MVKRRRKYNSKKIGSERIGKIILGITLIFFMIGLILYFANRSDNSAAEKERQEELRVKKLKEDFVNRVGVIAKRVNKPYGIFPSVTVAQAALESDFGRSGLSAEYNNLFGVKGSNPANTKELKTSEYVNGQWVEITDRFRVYGSYDESILDHALLFVNGTTWNKNQYIDVLNAQSASEAAVALQKDGYATDPDYAKKIMDLIKEFNLTRFD